MKMSVNEVLHELKQNYFNDSKTELQFYKAFAALKLQFQPSYDYHYKSENFVFRVGYDSFFFFVLNAPTIVIPRNKLKHYVAEYWKQYQSETLRYQYTIFDYIADN